MVEQLGLFPALALVVGVLSVGAWVVRFSSGLAYAVVAGAGVDVAEIARRPVTEARWLIRQQTVSTEAPDRITWVLAPAAYLGLAAVAMTVVPVADGVAVADVRTGIVVFGAAEALAIVAVFLHGWSPNSPFPLVAGYRFVGAALSYELLSMFVLIAAAIPAESLSIGAIVESQSDLWNVVRQPLGLPLWLVVALGVTFRGPLDVVDSADLAAGGATESSGVQRLVWGFGRAAMLAVFAAAGAAVFLGGWHGPLLPGAVWMALKSLGLVGLLVWIEATVARVSVERFVRLSWSVLLPLGFADLVIAGLGSL